MISNEWNIVLGLIAMGFVSYSWWIHYKTKDGLARLMLLWGSAILFIFVLIRTTGYALRDLGVLDTVEHQTLNMYNIWLIYVLIMGQFLIQTKKK